MDIKQEFIRVKRKLFDLYYSFLNEKQREAVFSIEGPLLVLAGAGSGKTTVLVNRIAYAVHFGNAYYTNEVPDGIREADVLSLRQVAENAGSLPKEALFELLKTFAYEPCPPWAILTFTFTKKAANEMKERLEKLLEEHADDVWTGTFHSICVRILRRYSDRLGYTSDFTIYDTDDSKKAVSLAIQELKMDEEVFTPKTVLHFISKAKNQFISPEKVTERFKDDFQYDALSKIYKRYQQKLKEANAVDFDDLICGTITLFEENPDVLEYYSSRFRYVLVDEYQDTNGAQYRLMSLLSCKYKNVMVVGDDDQSIYKFRGATIQNILDFDRHYPNSKTVYLEQNYRSTKTILNAANSLISHNENRKGKQLWTKSGDGEKIDFVRLMNQDHEARFIADRIISLVSEGACSYRDIAVLYRMNAQSNTIETALARAAIPHRLLGGLRFYDRKEIRDIVAYLCLINNPNDTVKLGRVINTPKRGIGDSTMLALSRLSQEQQLPVYEIMKNADAYPSLSKAQTKLKRFVRMIEQLSRMRQNVPVSELVKQTAIQSGYLDMLQSSPEDESERIDNINELISNAISYSENAEDPSLTGFLEDIALVSDVDSYSGTADAVVLMTMHSSKGLEFPYVFLPGMEENIFPSSQSSISAEELEEERRLAYVALTRAKKKIFILSAEQRLLYGRTSVNPISRFVKEIPAELIQDYNTQFKRAPASVPFPVPPRPFSERKPDEAPEIHQVGDRVVHQSFGEGVVMVQKLMGSDIYYEVEFENVGRKKMLGTYAKLKKA